MTSSTDTLTKEVSLILKTPYEKMVFDAEDLLHLGWQGFVRINGKKVIFSLGHYNRDTAIAKMEKLVSDIKKQKQDSD